MTREFSHRVKTSFKDYQEELITNQMVQRRLSWSCIWIHAMCCCLSRLNRDIRNGLEGEQLEPMTAPLVDHLVDMATAEIHANLAGLRHNTDTHRCATAADAAWARLKDMPHNDVLHSRRRRPMPPPQGNGKTIDVEIDSTVRRGDNGP